MFLINFIFLEKLQISASKITYTPFLMLYLCNKFYRGELASVGQNFHINQLLETGHGSLYLRDASLRFIGMEVKQCLLLFQLCEEE